VSGVHIVSDSSCDLSQDEIDSSGITVVPLSIRFGEEEFTDRRDLSVEDFYKRMAHADALPQTACPAPGSFEQAFRRAVDDGADAIVCPTISGALSNTLQSAETAAAALRGQIPIHVIDSRSVSSGLGTLLLAAAAEESAGRGLESVLATVEYLIPRTHVFAALNTLENLKKGGRIGGAKAMIGSMLAIKPLVDISGGAVRESGKARTRRKAMELLYERMTAAGRIDRIAVMHGLASDIDEFLELIAPRFPRGDLRVGTLGAVIGTHGGAEIIGVSWLSGP
jgi:DegV family protein with EDD domain